MTTTLIIARHGNTFKAGETPRRVGAKTDLPLTEEEKGTNIGLFLKANELIPNNVYSGHLKRQTQTAQLAMQAMGIKLKLQHIDGFNEIDYGPDENKTEEEVIARIGQKAIDNWNDKLILPKGWQVDTNSIIEQWQSFAASLKENTTNLVVSSNGIIRFAPHIMQNPHKIMSSQNMKVPTGSLCIFQKDDDGWRCLNWALRP